MTVREANVVVVDQRKYDSAGCQLNDRNEKIKVVETLSSGEEKSPCLTVPDFKS